MDARRTGDSPYVNTGSSVFHVYTGGLAGQSNRQQISDQLAKAIVDRL